MNRNQPRNESFIMQNTLGFAPIVTQKNRWCTPQARQTFLKMVTSRLEEKYKQPIVIHDEEEAYQILLRAVRIRGDTDEVLEESIAFVTTMLSTRIDMHNHLDSMRQDCIRLQPRGDPGRNKEELQRPTLYNSQYQKFLDAQKNF